MVAIDCGANVGEVTVLLARRGAEVHAFEPNPEAYGVLLERVRGYPRVRCSRTAVAATDGVGKLYLHQDAASDPVRWSAGSSLYAEKGNVDRNTAIDVDTIDLSRFIAELGRPVQLLKLDIEGAEIEVLGRLLDSGQLAGIRHVLVEMHDTKIPNLTAAGTRLRERLAHEGHEHVLLNWV
jgi:FkbM family methyltransferase